MRCDHDRHRSLLAVATWLLVSPVALVATGAPAEAQDLTTPRPQATPLRQSALDWETAGPPESLSVHDVSRDDRWLGVGVSDPITGRTGEDNVRWALDGRTVYFRWHPDPKPEDDPRADPWYKVDREGKWVQQVPEEAVHLVPASTPSWSADARRAAWATEGRLYFYDAATGHDVGVGSGNVDAPGHGVRPVYATTRPILDARMRRDGTAVDFTIGEDLFTYHLKSGAIRQSTRIHRLEPASDTELARWLRGEQFQLFEYLRQKERREAEARALERLRDPLAPQAIPVERDARVTNLQLSPDGRYVTFQWIRRDPRRRSTVQLDFVTASGYTEVLHGRSKGGEPPDEYRFGIVRIDSTIDPDSVSVHWVELPEAGGAPTIIHGPYWSVEGDRAVIQVLSRDHKHRWIARVNLLTGRTEVVDHQEEEAWIAGPPPIGGRLRPGRLEWIPGGRFVFASERTGWSHLYLAEPDGTVRALTSGEWEVRQARLSRDRTRWLVTASREHPADDHLYTMPAAGGELTRLTSTPGRHFGYPSPDGHRMAVVYSETVQLPDLYLADLQEGADASWVRVTVSGTDNYYRHRWVQPEIVTFPDEDGRPLWAALFKPERPNPERAAVIHIHGGGYRQFAHRGWSVYGYGLHLGMINYLVQQGYTVLDFDYIGSAGYGRDYRTDVYRSLGMTDVDGAVTAAEWLAREHDIDPERVGIYGISMGGFITLMALFRHPGVFAAGVAHAAPAAWEDDSEWPIPILNLPYEDPEAYRMASPIYYCHQLEDPLLIVHGFLDDNVHFHDAVRLVQRLLEHDREFEVMFYPVEEHDIAREESRYDYNRRLVTFFERHLLGR